jgi:hypothetical protein
LREVATTLTDYLLTVVCLVCAWQLAKHGALRLRGPVVFFAAFAAAALLGGTWHGYFSDQQGLGQEILWWLTMVFAGMAAAGLALTGLELLGARSSPRVFLPLALLLALYAVLAWRDARFLLSLIASVVGILLCAAGLLRHLRTPGAGARLALMGLGITVLAAIAQQQQVAFHRTHFDHNATYHVLLLPALAMLYAGFLRLMRKPAVPASHQSQVPDLTSRPIDAGGRPPD